MEKTPETFETVGITTPLLFTIKAMGYREPTAIQKQTIPAILAGKDVMGTSQTGSGKTAAFSLPILQLLSHKKRAGKKQIRALILCPTRELAGQIDESLKKYGQHFTLTTMAATGGVKINPQMSALGRGVDILTTTPGRLLDLYDKKSLNFKALEFLVLDEVDRMLNLGFSEEVNRILSLITGNPQSLLFSATISPEIRSMAVKLLKDPVEIFINSDLQDQGLEADFSPIEERVYPVDQAQKPELLIQMMRDRKERTLIFTRTKNGADRLVLRLEKAGMKASAIHGDKSQGARSRALKEFKEGKTSILIATDLASRGLDISGLSLVINYELPHLKEDYIHRIGRTGRAGAQGMAISLVCAREFPQLSDIERLTQQVIPRHEMEGFIPKEELPPSRLDLRPFKARKPKKSKKKNIYGEKNESL